MMTLPLDRLLAAHTAWHSTYAEAQATEAQKVAHHQITAGIAAAGSTFECGFTDPLIVDRAEGLSTEPDTYAKDLPVEVVAALRQAWDAGVPLVDVAAVLGPAGYEIRVLPCEPTDDPEEQFASLAGLDTEEEPEDDAEEILDGLAERLMDVLALSKGYSFESENRMISRNRKRKSSQEPHPFKASKYATRDGRVRCVMCGGGQPEKGSMCAGLGYAKAAPTKTEDGQEYPAEAFAYVPDPQKPSTWKLRLWDDPEQKVTARQVGRAAAALSPGGFRGNRVEIPAEDLPGVKRKILAAWRSVHAEDEQPPAILKAEDTFTPPQGVRDAARRALDWIKEGKAGSNFTDVGRARAAQLARGDSVSRETIGRMRSYFARHEVDRQAEGFSSGEDGFPSPGRVAWDAWGGDAGRSWVNGLWERISKSDPGVGAVHVDGIMGQPRRRARIRAAEDATSPEATGAPEMPEDPEGTYDPEDALTLRQEALYEAYEAIAEALGPWDGSVGPDGAHYMPAEENPFAEAGMKCANCVFYEGGGGCEILSMPVEPEGACKLWIIPEPLVSEDTEKAIGPHSYRKADDGENCSVCGQASDNWRHAAVGKAATFVQKADERRYTMGPMYVPNIVDAHGEWTDPDELQTAVWEYVRGGDRRIRLQHNRSVVAGEWVEVMAWPYEVTVPMLGVGEMRKLTYPANTVFLGVVWEPWAWELVKAGKLRGYSIGGKAERVLADLPESSSSEGVQP